MRNDPRMELDRIEDKKQQLMEDRSNAVEEDYDYLRRLRKRIDRLVLLCFSQCNFFFVSVWLMIDRNYFSTRLCLLHLPGFFRFLGFKMCSEALFHNADWLSGFVENRVGIDIPKVEIRFQNLSVEGEAYVGTRALPTLLNTTLNAIEVASILNFFVSIVKTSAFDATIGSILHCFCVLI